MSDTEIINWLQANTSHLVVRTFDERKQKPRFEFRRLRGMPIDGKLCHSDKRYNSIREMVEAEANAA